MVLIDVVVMGGPGVGKTTIANYDFGHGIRMSENDDPMVAHVIVAVYDTTRLETLDFVKSLVKSYGRYTPIVVAGNKNDIVSGILGAYTQSLPSSMRVVYTTATTGRGMEELARGIVESQTPYSRYCSIL